MKLDKTLEALKRLRYASEREKLVFLARFAMYFHKQKIINFIKGFKK